MQAAIYARTSRDDLESENQLRELRDFAGRRGWEILAQFVDADVRGDAARPQLQALLRAAHEKRFDVAVFWSLDRMTRAGVKDAIDTLYALDSAGVAFHSFREPYVNSLGPWRDAVIGLLATLAKMEKIRLSERTKAGLARARAQGKVIGRPPRRYAVDPAQVVRQRGEGASWGELAKRYGLPKTSVRRLCQKGQAKIDKDHRKAGGRT